MDRLSDQLSPPSASLVSQDPKFRQEEKVLCPDKDSMYEGIIRKFQYKKNGWRYFVHYLGWNARWDKWLDEKDILEASEANVEAMKKQLRKRKHAASDTTEPAIAKSKAGTTHGNNISPSIKQGPKGGLKLTLRDYCELPFTLKTILADDKDRIMRLGFEGGCDGFTPWAPARDVHVLPATVTIHSVLQHYVRLQRKAQAPDEANMEAAESKSQKFVSSLSDLLESALPVCLLYPTERAQFLFITERMKNIPLVEIYGCEFLLRLLVRLPALLLEAVSPKMCQQIASLIFVLQKNRASCFKPRYSKPHKEEWNPWEVAVMTQSKPCSHGKDERDSRTDNNNI